MKKRGRGREREGGSERVKKGGREGSVCVGVCKHYTIIQSLYNLCIVVVPMVVCFDNVMTCSFFRYGIIFII